MRISVYYRLNCNCLIRYNCSTWNVGYSKIVYQWLLTWQSYRVSPFKPYARYGLTRPIISIIIFAIGLGGIKCRDFSSWKILRMLSNEFEIEESRTHIKWNWMEFLIYLLILIRCSSLIFMYICFQNKNY